MTETETEVITENAFPSVIQLTERYDPNVMRALLLNPNKAYSERILRCLRDYQQKRHNGASVQVQYHFGMGCEEDKIGRIFAPQGLQGFQWDIRDPLTASIYFDIDMENCHFHIIEKLAEEVGAVHTGISHYINNREECLRRTSSKRSVAKRAYLKTAYGGSTKHFNSKTLYEEMPDYLIDDELPDGDITNVKEIEKEIKTIINLLKINPKFEKVLKKTKEKETSNKKARDKKKPFNFDFVFLALLCQTEERKCLEALYRAIKQAGRIPGILIHDGMRIERKEGETHFPLQLLRDAEKAILDETGYNMRLAEKPITHNFVMPNKEDIQEWDDSIACGEFIRLMGDNIRIDNNEPFFFNDNTGMWESGDNAYRSAVLTHSKKLIKKVGDKTFNYGGNNKNIMAMKNFLIPLLSEREEDKQWITNNQDSAIGKLLFKDGIFDFETGTFTKGFDNSIVFTASTNRYFPKERDEEQIDFVKKTLFINPFKEQDGTWEVGLYFAKGLTIGLIGDYRRKWYWWCLGESNCGKGTINGAFKKAFGGYIAEWDADNLLINKNTADKAKGLSWIMAFRKARIAFSQEMTATVRSKINTNLWKQLSSGGDTMTARINFQDETQFINKTMLLTMANDVMALEPPDDAIKTRAIYARWVNVFKRNPTKPNELKADDTLKDKVLSDVFADALTWVMIDTYQSMTKDERKIGGYIEPPQAVKDSTNDYVPEDTSDQYKDYIEELYEITGNKDDSVASSELMNYMGEKFPDLSKQKRGLILTGLISAVNPALKGKDRERNPSIEKDEKGKQRVGIKLREKIAYIKKN